MAERNLYLDSFHDLTAASDQMEVGKQLLPAFRFVGQGQINTGFRANVVNSRSVLYIYMTEAPTNAANQWFSFYTDLPLDGGYSVQVVLDIEGSEERRTIVKPVERFMKFDGSNPSSELYYYLSRYCTIEISILTSDRKSVFDGANRIYQTYEWPRAFSWTSKPFKLSDFLTALTRLELRLTDGSSRSAVLDWSRVGRAGYTPPSLDFDPVWKVRLYLAPEQAGPYDEFTRLPLPSEVASKGYRWARLNIYGFAPQNPNAPVVGVEEVVLGLAEEYASEAPSLDKRVVRSNLYVPRLQVVVGGVDVTRFVASVSNTEIAVLDNTDWVRSACIQGASVSVTLDGQLLVTGIVGELRKEQYLNGNILTMHVIRPIDMLGRSEDVEIVTKADGENNTLPFGDDLGYITYLVNAVVPGTRVMADDRTGWRPIWVWKQRPQSGEHRFVQLDTDYDWLQLYAVNNSSVREKIERVAQANGFLVSSFAGNLFLTPITPYPNEDIMSLYRRARILHMTADGRFFPEVRFGVPELRYSDAVPKELTLTGLADAVPETLSRHPVVFRRADGSWTDKLHIAGFHPHTQGDTFVRINGQYYRAVFKNLNVKIDHVEGLDLNPFAENQPYYRFVYGTISGYYGIVGVEFWMSGSFLEYDDYFLSAEGELLYYDGGQRDDKAMWKATGRYAPQWARFPDGTNLVGHLLSVGDRMNGPKENIENPFVPKYDLPNGAESWTLGNYTLFKNYGDRLVDMLATRKALERVLASMPVIGPAGFKTNDIVGIARLPEDGVGGRVREVDLYIVLEEPETQITPGGQVRSTVHMGYIGTIKDGQPVYNDMAVSWNSLPPGTDTWYL